MIKVEMIKWLDETIITWLNELIFSKKNKKSDNLIIWSINWFLFHHIIVWFFMHERFDFESHLFIWDDSCRSFFINVLISHRVVLRLFNRDDFLSDLLIFKIVERLMSSKMNVRFWWNQIEVTTKNENDLIKRKNLRDKRRSWFSNESRWIKKWKSVNRWMKKIFYIINWIFHSF
jgi:hypothetical protein